MRRLAVMVVVLAVLLIPRPASLLETEVRQAASALRGSVVDS